MAYFPTPRMPAILAILAFSWIALAPGIMALPPIDRDEARYAQASKQMLESGDFVRIRFQDEPRHKKPVGIYWLEAASAWTTGLAEAHEIWPYRLPSLLGAMSAILLTFAFGRGLVGPKPAFLAAGFLGASLLLAVVARQAHTDAVLLATAVAAQGALGWIYVGHRRGAPPQRAPALLFWAAQGLAILIKGPVVPAVSLLTGLALLAADRHARWWRGLRPLIGVPLMLAIAAPWFVAINLATDGGFIADAVGNDLLPKLVTGQEGHGAPPGYYLLMMMLAFWPGSLFSWPALAVAWRERLDPAIRFLLAWLIPAWILFELVPTKLPSYVLPAYPALALLTAHLVGRAAAGAATPLDRRWPRWIAALWLMLSVALALAPPAIGLALGRGLELPTLLVALFAIAIALWVAWIVRSRRWLAAASIAIVGAAVVFAADFGWLMPRMGPLWVSRAAADSVARFNRSEAGAAAVASVGYTEPSLVFLVGTAIALVGPDAAARQLAASSIELALVRDREDAAFRQAADAVQLRYRPLDTIGGFNYSRGQWVNLTLYGRAP